MFLGRSLAFVKREWFPVGRRMSSWAACAPASGLARVPPAVNEIQYSYEKGSKERFLVEESIKEMRKEQIEIPLIIGGEEVRTGNLGEIRIPHDHKHVLAVYHKAGEKEIKKAISCALEARKMWSSIPFEDRLSIFLKCADLAAGPFRAQLNAATILGQSKNFIQAEIDSACELVDFWRFNAEFAQQIYQHQTISPPFSGVWNRLQYRPLEGFVYAASPFNFTAIGGNLTSAPAMMGNVVLWKPSDSAVYSNYLIQRLYQEGGLPPGVINFLPGDPELITNTVLNSSHFAGLHYTGSTRIFQLLWKKIGERMPTYKVYPRIVGETGGKDFIFAHSSADVDALVPALILSSFEYAGQKCSACSRAYIPESLWPEVEQKLFEQMKSVKVGNPEEVSTFMNAVINRQAFDKLKNVIDSAKQDKQVEIIYGGSYDDSHGYFIDPTIVKVKDPQHRFMSEEFFGPLLSIYVYKDEDFHKTLQICNETSIYALSGAVFARDRYTLLEMSKALEDAAGNFYINDRCTGSIVGQQPFGGGRQSGTNDKAGSYLNLIRWINLRTVKENFLPSKDVLYPYMLQP